ncbi:hypothetical protein PFISCL1PPCAC_12682, partial [Pristionchus fissidentatus]
ISSFNRLESFSRFFCTTSSPFLLSYLLLHTLSSLAFLRLMLTIVFNILSSSGLSHLPQSLPLSID